MKKLLFVLLSIGLAFGAAAQKVIVRGGTHHYVRPHVAVGLGLGYGYAPFYPYYGFNPWYGPSPYAWGYPARPSRLDRTVQDIKQDYADRIKSVRLQDDMTGHEKRLTIRDLRQERDKAVLQAQKDYYHQRSGKNRNTTPPQNDNNNNNENNAGSDNS